jgi:acyl-CoA synthetase (AMP-forming)/AMP-acid ligase II
VEFLPLLQQIWDRVDAGKRLVLLHEKDGIKSGGEWISSLQLEDLILRHPGVAEVAIIGLPEVSRATASSAVGDSPSEANNSPVEESKV